MSAEYAIEIAAAMPAGEATIAQLESLASALTASGAQSTKFFQQIAEVSSALDAARAASAAANASLGEGNAMYRELEKAANMAAKAVEKAGAKGVIDPAASRASAEADAALQAYASTLKGLEGASASAAAKEKQLAAQLDAVKVASTAADKAIAAQGKAAEAAAKGAVAAAAKESAAFDAAKTEAAQLAKANEALGVKSGKASRELVGLAKIDKLKDAFGSASGAATVMVGATVAAAAAVAALTIAVIAGVVAFASWAVGLADAKRSAALSKEAAEALVPGLVELRGDFAAIGKETGASGAEMRAWVKQLDAAKVKAEDLPDALRAVALSSAALGQEGVGEFFDQLKASKGAVSDLSASVSGKLGPIVAKQMRGLDAQAATFKANISSLFGGLNIEPVLAGLERLVGLFDQTTVAGQTIKFLFESVFQPLIDQADNAAIVVEAFALGFLIGMTKVYIALKPAIKAVSEFFGFKDTSLTDLLDIATKAGEYAAYIFVGFVAALVAVGAAIAVVVVPLIAMQAAVYAMIAALVAAVVYVDSTFISAFEAVWDFLSGLPAKMVTMGSDLIMGLVNGITGAASAVADAVTGAVGGAIDAAKKKLGIASPSKVFAEIGGYTGEGFVGGVEDSAPDAQAAMTDMVDPAPAAAKAKSAPDSGGSSGKSGGSYAGAQFNFYGVEGAEDAIARFREMLMLAQEGDLAALGGGGGEAAQ